MDSYLPTPEQVAGMQAVIAKRLAQWDEVYALASTDPVWDGDTDGTSEWERGYVEGKAVLLDEVREILGMHLHREQVQHWCAGWNQRSYSSHPDDVMHGGTLKEAFEYVQSQLEFERDNAADGYDEQALIDVIDKWTHVDQREVEVQAGLSKITGGYFSATVNGWEYWVQACYTVDCDQIDKEE